MAHTRTSREERLEQVRRWLASGLSGAEFGRKAGVPAGTLAWWRWKLRSEGVTLRPRARRALPFVEITPMPAEGSRRAQERLELEVDGVTLRVPEGFDEPTLTRLLGVLRGPR
jgi:hypothetical protein